MVEPATDDPQRRGAGWRRHCKTTVLAAAVVAIAALGLTWLWTRPGTLRSCTMTAAISNPAAATPEEAVDAWWAADGAADVAYWRNANRAVEGPPATREDFVQIGDTEWEWRYSETGAVGVAVGPAPDGGARWTVAAVNGCGYGPEPG